METLQLPVIDTPLHNGFSYYNVGSEDAFEGHDMPLSFTPSLVDANADDIHHLLGVPAGCCAPPTTAGTTTNMLFHPPASDRHTPVSRTVWGELERPLFLSTSFSDSLRPRASASVMELDQGFQPLLSHHPNYLNSFMQAPSLQLNLASSSFMRQDAGYETIGQSTIDGLSVGTEGMTCMNSMLHDATLPVAAPSPRRHSEPCIAQPVAPSAKKLRFYSVLKAPTAIFKQADNTSVTYLNRGQAYFLSITGTLVTAPLASGTKFRTFVRISFEGDERRQQTAWKCWSLWKEKREANQAQQRGAAPNAVEYVYAGQPAEGDEMKARVELETASFDGFSVTWTPGAQSVPEVRIAVRFNFLSTDFSLSKGVKGIPVRLCAKTSLVTLDTSNHSPDLNSEIYYCLVKLFRDHGAERKHANDVAHVNKSIAKVKHRILQAESHSPDFGKRKRSGRRLNDGQVRRPSKVQKHLRKTLTTSLSSGSKDVEARDRTHCLSDTLHEELQALQDVCTSTTPASVLNLREENGDDPDTHPVIFPGDWQKEKSKNIYEGRQRHGKGGSNLSTGSDLTVTLGPLSSRLRAPAQVVSGLCHNIEAISSDNHPRKGSVQPIMVQKTDKESNPSGFIEAIEVDQSYIPPSQRRPKPAACFYVRGQRNNGESAPGCYYYAIYIPQRKLKDLNHCLGKKFGFDPSMIMKTIHVGHNQLEMDMNDESVLNLKEGQVMALQVEDLQPPVKGEHEMVVDTDSLVLRLIY